MGVLAQLGVDIVGVDKSPVITGFLRIAK